MTQQETETGLVQFCCRIKNTENNYLSCNFMIGEDEQKVPAQELLDIVSSKEYKESTDGCFTVECMF